jgi:DNA-directed RNA polymerase specialized sigma24 family protein
VKREIEEKSLPVIAQELEVPEESVKHLLFRAAGRCGGCSSARRSSRVRTGRAASRC